MQSNLYGDIYVNVYCKYERSDSCDVMATLFPLSAALFSSIRLKARPGAVKSKRSLLQFATVQCALCDVRAAYYVCHDDLDRARCGV